MVDINLAALEAALDALPKRYAGPGGVVGVVHEGRVIASRAWGFADLTQGRALTPQTRLPICSISKQFTCQVLLATLGDLAAHDAKVADYLPAYTGTLPSLRQLADNQSGLRDYWALTVLQGAHFDQIFRREDALPLIAKTKTGHFEPGAQYSYCNCNYRILSEIIEAQTGETLEALYQRHIWGPAGMTGAELTSDTRYPADQVVGYEGNEAAGWFPAENAIYWIGDAGISASLQDMLAYEQWIDANREDPAHLYRQVAVDPHYADGSPASYGFGLSRRQVAGHGFTGHGGALRGFRAQRYHSYAARLSVVVMFNHDHAAGAAAVELLEAALGVPPAPALPVPEGWAGQYLCAETGLYARLNPGRDAVELEYGTGAETLRYNGQGLEAYNLGIAREGDALVMRRGQDHAVLPLEPLPVVAGWSQTDLGGRYHSAEIEGEIEIDARDGGAYARFSGMLGQGAWERLDMIGPDVWRLAIRRSMDAPAPGDWTLQVERDAAGAILGLRIGCWLARNIDYRRL